MAEYELPERKLEQDLSALKPGDVEVQAPPASLVEPAAAEESPEPEAEQEEETFEQVFPVSDIPTRTDEATAADIQRVARDVIAGNWGAGEDRRKRLTESNYDYDAVQAEVNAMLDPGSAEHRNYSVQPGDTLKGIANRIDFKGGYQTLHNKNRGIIGNDPNVALRPGQVLSL